MNAPSAKLRIHGRIMLRLRGCCALLLCALALLNVSLEVFIATERERVVDTRLGSQRCLSIGCGDGVKRYMYIVVTTKIGGCLIFICHASWSVNYSLESDHVCERALGGGCPCSKLKVLHLEEFLKVTCSNMVKTNADAKENTTP